MPAGVDYGRDVSCTTSLRTGRYVSGIQLLGEAIFRRLTTKKGSLVGGEEEALYGLDLLGLIGKSNPRLAAATLPAQIQGELAKDERIHAVRVQVTTTVDGLATTIDLLLEVESDVGPFDLKLRISDVTVELLGVSA